MKSTLSAILLFVIAFIGLLWLVQGNDFVLYKAFAPKYEAVRRETFEQSKAYRQGLVQELQNMQFEYVKADKEHQAALASIILRRTADVPTDALTPDLNKFVDQLRRERLEVR
jgi:hypothetical protein